MYPSFSKRYHRHPSTDDAFRRGGHSGTRRHSFASEPDGGYIRATGFGGLSSSDCRRYIGSVDRVAVSSVPHYPDELTSTPVVGSVVGRPSLSSEMDGGFIRPTGFGGFHGGLSSYDRRVRVGSIGYAHDRDELISTEARGVVGRHSLSSESDRGFFRPTGSGDIYDGLSGCDHRVRIGSNYRDTARSVPDEVYSRDHGQRVLGHHGLSSYEPDCVYHRESGFGGLSSSNSLDNHVPIGSVSLGRNHHPFLESSGAEYGGRRSVYEEEINNGGISKYNTSTERVSVGSLAREDLNDGKGARGFTAIHNGIRGMFIPNCPEFTHEDVSQEEETNSSSFSSTNNLMSTHEEETSTNSSSSSSTNDFTSTHTSTSSSTPQEYPPDQILTDNDDLLASFLSLPQFQHLLRDTIDNVVFIFEEYTVPTTRSLSSMGPLSAERWLLTKPRLHCVMQNTSDTGMYYLAKSAESCHYQVHIRSLIKSLIAYEGDTLDVFIYNPTKDYSNDFMVIGNTVQATKTMNKKISWDSIKTLLSDHEHTICLSSDSSQTIPRKRKRQSLKSFVDFGWTSSICQSRSGSQSGVALPRLKPGTDHITVKKIFSGLSKIVKKIDAPWIDSPLESLFQDSTSPDRQSQFQDRIVPGNIIEALRVAKSNVNDLCAPHEDTQNSTKTTMMGVLCISKVVTDTRYAGIGYGRKSVDVATDEAIRVDPFTSAIVEFYRSIEECQRTVSPRLLGGCRSSPIPSFPVISNHCNLDPFSYQLTFVELVLRLIQKFDLNMIEIVSVVTCYELFPHCLYYFGVAANIFIQDLTIEDTKNFRGSLFGYKISEIVMHIFHLTREVRCTNFRKNSTGETTKLPPSRFNCYTGLEKLTTLQSSELWEERCHHKLHHLLMFNDKYWKTKNQPTMKTAYGKLMKQLIPYAPNCGTLTLLHEVGILSSLGLLPLWVFSFASVDYDGKPMKYFQETFPCIAETDEKKRSSTIITLTSALNEIFRSTLSIRDTENIICKAYRSKRNTNHFRDLIFPNQCVITFRHDGFKIHDFEGQSLSFTGSLIKKWPCAGDFVSMTEVVNNYKRMIKDETNDMFAYVTGMHPTSEFLKKGNGHICYEFDLPFIAYGDKNTKSASRRITDKVLFR